MVVNGRDSNQVKFNPCNSVSIRERGFRNILPINRPILGTVQPDHTTHNNNNTIAIDI